MTVTSGLEVKGIECLLPLYCERRRWSDRSKAAKTPLFSGYVFCCMDRSARAQALRTPGAIRVVGFGGLPLPLEEAEVQNLRALALSPVAVRPSAYLAVGQKVRITDGPFAGLSGFLEEIRGERRLIVSLNLLQRSVAVEVGAASVQPVGTSLLGVRSA